MDPRIRSRTGGPVPVNLSIKNVPDSLARALRERAAAHRRSLQGELMRILEEAAGLPDAGGAADAPRQPSPRRLSVDDLMAFARDLLPAGTPSSVELIRDERDARAGPSRRHEPSDRGEGVGRRANPAR
jgi:plasmid stability protein